MHNINLFITSEKKIDHPIYKNFLLCHAKMLWSQIEFKSFYDLF